jgi:rhodanese-related sulfurtransferase
MDLQDPWLLSGMILVAVTAILAMLFLFFRPAPQSVTPETARELIREGWISRVIDVNEPIFFHEGSYSNSAHILIKDLVKELPRLVRNHSHSILFYDNEGGGRAAYAGLLAQDLGYTNVRYLRYGTYKDLEETRLMY